MKRLTTLLIFSLILFDASYGQHAIVGGNIANLPANSIKCSFIPNTLLEKVTSFGIPVTNGAFTQTLDTIKPTFLSFADGKNWAPRRLPISYGMYCSTINTYVVPLQN